MHRQQKLMPKIILLSTCLSTHKFPRQDARQGKILRMARFISMARECRTLITKSLKKIKLTVTSPSSAAERKNTLSLFTNRLVNQQQKLINSAADFCFCTA